VQVQAGNAVFDQEQQILPVIAFVIDLLETSEDQRMVRHDELAAKRLRLFKNVHHRIERDEDLRDLPVKPSAQKPHVVPVHFHVRRGKGK